MCYHVLAGTTGLSEGFGLTLTVFYVANDLGNVSSSSVSLSSGLILGGGVAVDEVVETKSRQGPNIDSRACTGSPSLATRAILNGLRSI